MGTSGQPFLTGNIAVGLLARPQRHVGIRRTIKGDAKFRVKPTEFEIKKMMKSDGLNGKIIRPMNSGQAELYSRIQSFSLDKPGAKLSFTKRLARDNGWSLQYTQQVIEEYKKFAFLAVVAGHPVTPSDQVDQAWHLHLTYTRSYWEEFCATILQTPLHHNPTLGGEAENQKFDDWYSKTLESYERFFETKPPVEIWPTPKDRFGRDLHFVRINTQHHWILPKLPVQTGAAAVIAILCPLILSGCYISGPEANVDFPAVIILSIICVAAVFGIIRFLIGIINFRKNPPPPRSRGNWDDSNCGTTDCQGWDIEQDNSDSHSSSDFSSCNSDSGCRGSGCGGCGGCGGGE
ncbi:MAG TPA: hypothetical protein V6D19_07870 [Stenomitos sp.]